MTALSIFDLRFLIYDFALRRLARGDHDCGQFVRFLEERFDEICGEQFFNSCSSITLLQSKIKNRKSMRSMHRSVGMNVNVSAHTAGSLSFQNSVERSGRALGQIDSWGHAAVIGQHHIQPILVQQMYRDAVK
jgi:hypothetical protein